MISIITSTYNSEGTLRTTLDSILQQSIQDYECLIIDGGSNDSTLEVVESYKKKFGVKLRTISEPDEGIYDAMNKGINMASGDVIGFLNSDDFYAHNQVLENISYHIKDVDAVYSNIIYVDPHNPTKIIRYWNTGTYPAKKGFRYGWHPAHPTFYVRTEIYRQHGGFNLDFKLAADFEIMLRFIEKHKIRTRYINDTWVHMRLGGATNKNLSNIMQQNKECLRAFRENGINAPTLYPLLRLLPKIKQYYAR